MRRIKQLYQQKIMDLAKNPFQFYKLENATHEFTAYNPLCGDKFTFYLIVQQGKILDASFTGFGCVISKASSAQLVSKLIEQNVTDLSDLIHDFFNSLKGSNEKEIDPDYLPFLSVREFPERIDCVLLGWQELKRHLKKLS